MRAKTIVHQPAEATSLRAHAAVLFESNGIAMLTEC